MGASSHQVLSANGFKNDDERCSQKMLMSASRHNTAAMTLWLKRFPPELALIPLMALLHWTWYFAGMFSVSPHASWLGDGFILHRMADSFLKSSAFLYTESVPTLTQLPTYPALIAWLYSLSDNDTRWVLQFQMLTACLSLPIFVGLLRPFLGKWRWLWAGFWMLDLHNLLYTGCLTTEFWICQCWMFAWALGSRGIEKQSAKHYFAAIALLILAAWIKPLSLYFPVFFFAATLFALRANWKKALLWTSCSGLLYALSLAPIYVRNHQLTGEWRYTTISSFNLWYFNIPYYLALKSEDDVYTLRAKQVDLMRQALNREGADIAPIPKEVAMDRLAHRQALGLSEYEYAKWADRLSAPFFKKHFWSYVLHHLNHGLQIFTVSNLSWLKLVFHSFEAHSFGTSPFHWWSVLQQGDLVSWMLFCRLLEVFSVGFYLIAALFALGHFSIKKNMPAWVSLGLSFIVYVPLVCGVNVWGRFRYLFMPMLIAFAVIGIVNGVHAIARRLQRTKLQK